MPTKFDALVIKASAVVDNLYGENFVIRPYALGADKREAAAPDPTRDTLRLVGVFKDKPEDQHQANAWDRHESLRPGVSSNSPSIEFSRAAASAFVTFDIRSGDHIERLLTGTTYEARAPYVTANGLIRVPISRLGKL